MTPNISIQRVTNNPQKSLIWQKHCSWTTQASDREAFDFPVLIKTALSLAFLCFIIYYFLFQRTSLKVVFLSVESQDKMIEMKKSNRSRI
jgi:hypothetical protein